MSSMKLIQSIKCFLFCFMDKFLFKGPHIYVCEVWCSSCPYCSAYIDICLYILLCRSACSCFTSASYLVLFSRSEPYVEVETYSSIMKAALVFQRNWAQESSRVNQLNLSNCYVASVVVPDGVVVSTPD